MNKPSNESTAVKSAHRVVDILELLAKKPSGLTFTSLNVQLEIPKSSLHQLLSTLVDTRVIQYDATSKNYLLGTRLWEFAMTYVNSLDVVQLSQPFLERLRDKYNETVQMAILDGSDIVYIAKVNSQRPVQLASQVGSRLPAYATGIGKALLACLPRDTVARIYSASDLSHFTSSTMDTLGKLLENLDLTRARGYALDLGEYSPEIRCIAIPMLGFNNSLKAAISFSMSKELFVEDKIRFLADGLSECAKEISHRLGADNPDIWRSYH